MPDTHSATDAALTALSDAAALQLLRLIAEGESAQAPSSAEREAALALASAPGPAPGNSDGDGEAARLALRLLASDPRHQPNVAALLARPPGQRFAVDPITVSLLSAGILLALQTHVEFERDKEGKWSLKIKKKPTSDGLIGPLIKKLAALMKSGD